ncbi:MAG TPA: response regulator [Macromonas sp.]|nr:response regulator [Macromonas sp.]
MSTVKNILVVDDSRTELVFLKSLLTRHGYSVQTAENAQEALQRLGDQVPDLILMDVVMPGTNGFQLTRTITRHPQYAKVPVFICSSKGQESDRIWGLRQGAREYLTKPVDPTQLLSKIEAVAVAG